MIAKVKCSNCGAELTNLNFTWGKKQWLWSLLILPMLLIGFFPLWNLYKPKGDYTTDLRSVVLEKRVIGRDVEILGTIKNVGNTRWKNIRLDAVFFH